MFPADGFFEPFGLDGAVVASEGEIAEMVGHVGADDGAEGGFGEVLEVTDRAHPGAEEGLAGDLPDAPDGADGKRPEPRRGGVRVERHDGQAVGLAVFGAEFGEIFVGGDAHGAGQLLLAEDVGLDFAPDFLGRAEEASRAGHVKEGLVHRPPLDQRRVASENGENPLRDGGVLGHVGRQEDAVRAEASGLGAGHGGMDAVAPRLVGGGADDAAFGGLGADDDGLAAQFGTVADFD